MKRLVHALAAMVRRSPVLVLVAALVLTVVFGMFAGQAEQSSGNEGFSPDTPEFRALDIISEYFSDNSEEPVQIVVEGDDLITAAGLRDYLAINEAITGSRASELLKDRPGGDIVGYLDPVVQGLQAQAAETGTDFETLVAEIDDAGVEQMFTEGLAALPPEVSELFAGLFGASSDLDSATASTGLMVAFLNVGGLDDPDQVLLQEIEVDMAEAVAGADTEVSEATAFSFALLFADQDEFASEVGRLFAAAFLIIVLILMFVYWVSPRGRMTRRYALRRALADMGLTMVVIVMSITWMNGIGVLLGPKYAGWIGNFNEILQIIPVLLIGLGVDYAIHMTSRYREELGLGENVINAAGRATRTVGVALVLATATTSVGFLTNIVNPVTALRDFGILAAVGIMSAFLLMLTVVPSARVLLDRRAERSERLPTEAFGHNSERILPRLMGATSVLAERLPAVTLSVALLLALLGGWGLTQLETTFSFTDFLPEDSPLLVTYDTITEEFAGGFGEETSVIIEGDVATPGVHNAVLASWGNMADTTNVVQFGGRAAAESPISVIGQLVTPPDQGGSPELYDVDFANFAVATGLQPDLSVPDHSDVEAIYRAAFDAAPEAMARTIAESNGAFRYLDIGVSTQAGEQGALQLGIDLGEDFAPVVDAGATAVATNQNIVGAGVVEALNDSQVSSLAITILAAMALLVITFWVESRRPFLGVITIAPVVLIVLWIFGIMSARGISFNPVTAMIANLAIGIGVPYTIHITHRFQEDRLRFATTEEAIKSTATHTGGALAGSAFTTAAGFGILMTSTLKPFQQLGEVTAWAILLSLVASVLVLPSMLVLWDRWHRRRGESAVDPAAVAAAFGDDDGLGLHPEGVPGA